jgi:4-hydroxybenzoate polyprenyltransferase
MGSGRVTGPPRPAGTGLSRPKAVGPLAALGGLIRIVHPFPSLLDAAVTGVLVLVAGGAPAAAFRLAGSMFALQAAIGTANDLADEPLDRHAKPAKPLPAGLVSRPAAHALLVVLITAGLVLAAASGPILLGLAVVGIGIGFLYDLRLKGTLWSWLPFALGIPLLPVFAWLGATGGLPAAFVLLLPVGVIAGAALALANLLADLERDERAGARTLATRLGRRRTWQLASGLLAVVLVAAGISLIALGGRGGGLALAAGAAAVVFVGMVVGRGADPRRRERAWELEATGIGLLAAGWVAALVGTPSF